MTPEVIGMTKRQVRRELGRPDAKTSSRAYLRAMRRQGATVMALGHIPNQSFWLYAGTLPDGGTLQVIFHRGRVVRVLAVPANT